jgi:hypothetical protein
MVGSSFLFGIFDQHHIIQTKNKRESRNRTNFHSPLCRLVGMNVSSDNPQKDNFHNVIFRIDKMVRFGIVNLTILTGPSLSRKRGWWMEKDL